jgi:hypothetical protein
VATVLIEYLAHLLKASLLKGHFPTQWKAEHIILIILVNFLLATQESRPLYLQHLIGSCYNSFTKLFKVTDWNHLICSIYGRCIRQWNWHITSHSKSKPLQSRNRCSAAFSETSVFDKLWPTGIPSKCWKYLALSYFLVLKSYWHRSHLLVNVETEHTELYKFNASVPQSSVLGGIIIPVIHRRTVLTTRL